VLALQVVAAVMARMIVERLIAEDLPVQRSPSKQYAAVQQAGRQVHNCSKALHPQQVRTCNHNESKRPIDHDFPVNIGDR
jgi:cbb3-type cytochrome oxidase cytochrome c subunit